MILYHTSDREIAKPDISFSRLFLDFGRGFYVTPNKNQALKYARRFFKEDRRAFVSTYNVDDSKLTDFSRRVFDAYDEDWLDYVVTCRKNEQHEMFDIIEGGIADDDVFNTLDLYMSDLIPKEEAIKRLKKKKPNWQICFCNQQLIDCCFQFMGLEELFDTIQEK